MTTTPGQPTRLKQVTATTHRHRDWDPRLLVGLAVAVAALAVGALVGATLLRGEAVTVEEQRDAVVAEKTSLAEQIRAACLSGDLVGPVCGQAEQVLAQPIPGPQGATGPPGRDGVSPPCLFEPSRCRGADGAQGAAGVAGEPGPAGMDGRDGADGADGAPGAPGPAGRDGSPAAGFTMTFPDGSTQTCARTGGPDTAPTYECGPVQPPDDDPPPTEGGGLLGG